jgi:hypothetical protein
MAANEFSRSHALWQALACQFEPYLHALGEWDPSETYESPKNTEWLAARKRTNAITRPFEDP